jgi:hypothetical protein
VVTLATGTNSGWPGRFQHWPVNLGNLAAGPNDEPVAGSTRCIGFAVLDVDGDGAQGHFGFAFDDIRFWYE